MEDSINQLQELYQKKYLEAPAEYSFEEFGEMWNCDCVCGGVSGFGKGESKKKAKKKAAYVVLVRLLEAAGICEEAWKKEMYRAMVE